MKWFARTTRPVVLVASVLACHGGSATSAAAPPTPANGAAGTLAQVIYWRARPGKYDEYSRYISQVAEPIDEEARRSGAFLSITTYATRDTASAWTHMRVFVLRDSAQLRGLSAALDAAGRRLEPDSAKRAARGAYSATLRDRVGTYVAEIIRR